MKMHLAKFVTLIAATGVSGWLFASGGGEHGLPRVDHPAWRQECGSCHLAFHPGLLPARSWHKVMDGLERHFGENAALDDEARAAITEFLVSHAADRLQERRAVKIAAAIPAGQAPLRISESPWFARKHHEVGAQVWKRESVGGPANCAACHPGAERGDFGERDIRIPR